MSPRRRVIDSSVTDPDLDAGGSAPLRVDLVVAESEEEMEGWSRDERRLYAELLEDAASELQRELLRRALAAGHAAAELHAFADAIRPLSDADVFAACTPSTAGTSRQSVEERLWAEADPIYAYELNGGHLTPRREVSSPDIRVPPGLLAAAASPSLPRRELGSSADEPTTTGRNYDAVRPEPAPERGRLAEELFNEALRPLGFSVVEQLVDGVDGMPLDKALGRAAEALMSGVPVPVLLGASERDFRRYALMLQFQFSGQSRVFQVHDPVAHETVWIHEGDFRAKKELPFSDKTLRCIAAIAMLAGGKR